MKYLIACLLLSLFVAPLALPDQTDDLQHRAKAFRNNKKFKVEYDRFKDETRVSVGWFIPDSRTVEIEAYYFFKGKQPTETVAEIYFVLRTYSRSGDWRFLNNRTLYGTVDGERLDFGEGRRSSHIEPHILSESLRFSIPTEMFKRIASAKSAEFKIAAVEFALNGEHLAAFRDLISLAPQP
jgi:hypothetical protein